jgi:hypothetical protein
MMRFGNCEGDGRWIDVAGLASAILGMVVLGAALLMLPLG